MMNFIKKHLTKSIKLATLCSMVVGGVQLSYANIYDEFKKSPSAVSTITHTDRMIAVLDVNREQTARTPADIGETRLAVMMEQAAAQSVLDTARSIISYTQDTTPGVGLSRSSTCEAMIEHKTHVKRHDLSTKVRHAIAKSKAATYYQNEGNKRQLRALDHYANYCDLSEAKYGNCLPAPNAKGGMNVSYGNIANNMTLTEDQINAGYSYVNNVIDPSKTDLSKCKTAVCNALKIEEAQYHAVGSAIQNALLQQMQDSIVYDEPPGGIKTITVEQLGELSAPWDGNLVAWDEAAGSASAFQSSDAIFSSGKPSSGFTPRMAAAIKASSERLGIDPNHLAAIISFESGFSTTARNPWSSAVGLIQFTSTTARELGTTTAALARMSIEEQMVYVEKYMAQRIASYKRMGVQTNDVGALYAMVTGCYRPQENKCYWKSKHRDVFAKNPKWDADGDGIITLREAGNAPAFIKHRKKYF